MGVAKLRDKLCNRRKVHGKQQANRIQSKHPSGDDESTITSVWSRLKTSVKGKCNRKEKDIKHCESEETAENSIPTTIVTRQHESTVSSVASSSMYMYATATAEVANEFYEEDPSGTTQRNLYKPTPLSQAASQMVYPVACKRDILVEPNTHHLEKENSQNQYAYTSSSHQHGKSMPVQSRALKPYSISGSMLCDKMEKGSNVSAEVASAPKTTLFSPQRPKGLPPNTILASMLFQTMEQESGDDSKQALESSYYYRARVNKKATTPTQAKTRPSRSKNSSRRTPLRQTNNLMSMMQASSFEEFETIPEEREPHSYLYEA